MKIEMVNLIHVDQVWPAILPWVSKAHKRCEAEVSPGQLWQGCRSGNLFLILGCDDKNILAFSIVRFEQGHAGTVLSILYLGGSGFKEWGSEMVAYLKSMAKENGAKELVTQGSPAWGRLLNGVRKIRHVYSMETEQ